MRRTLSFWAMAALIAAPATLVACGDDDDTPGGSAGRPSTDGGDHGGGETSAGGKTGAGGKNAGGEASAGRPNGGGASSEGGAGAGTDAGGAAGSGEVGGAGSGGGPRGGCDLSGEGKERKTLDSDITEDTELDNAYAWQIEGTVKVREGATLTIPACTRLEGLADPTPGFLAVLRGGKLVAEGTANEPILFTSSKPVGERAIGDWGGVVLLGRARITRPNGATEAIYEGLTEADYTYGGDDDEDSSGSLKYVRIEYSGWEIFPDKEVNGLSMAGVGSGTTIDHVMVSNTQDDCFEWWGGTVRPTYLIANNCGDDYFDGDEGFRGGASYIFGRRKQFAISSDDPTGFEQDSIEAGDEPRTAFEFTNATLCGTGEPSGRPNPQYGMVLRELVTGSFENLALTGFEYGIDTRDAFVAGDVTMSDSKFWGLLDAIGAADPANDTSSTSDNGFDDGSIFTDGEDNEEPDPAPFTVEECLADGGPATSVIDSGIGAFPDGAAVAEWHLDGAWVDWSEE